MRLAKGESFIISLPRTIHLPFLSPQYKASHMVTDVSGKSSIKVVCSFGFGYGFDSERSYDLSEASAGLASLLSGQPGLRGT